MKRRWIGRIKWPAALRAAPRGQVLEQVTATQALGRTDARHGPLAGDGVPRNSETARRQAAIIPDMQTPENTPPPNPHPKGEPALRVMMMPRDTNAHGTIFGGVILSHIDQAGAVEARRHGWFGFVTVAMDRVEFKQPVYVGDVLSFCTETLSVGRTSVRVRVRVWADRWAPPRETIHVTDAEVVYVAVDENRRPVQLKPPTSL